jgi:hypothetical protein
LKQSTHSRSRARTARISKVNINSYSF